MGRGWTDIRAMSLLAQSKSSHSTCKHNQAISIASLAEQLTDSNSVLGADAVVLFWYSHCKQSCQVYGCHAPAGDSNNTGGHVAGNGLSAHQHW